MARFERRGRRLRRRGMDLERDTEAEKSGDEELS
jgi:hypothetical protein